MSHAITRDQAVSMATRLSARDARYQQERAAIESGLIRKATVSVAAAGMGALKKHGVPDDIKGFPWKLAVWVGATALEVLSPAKSLLRPIAAATSDSVMAVYVHDAVLKGSLIAGEGGEI